MRSKFTTIFTGMFVLAATFGTASAAEFEQRPFEAGFFGGGLLLNDKHGLYEFGNAAPADFRDQFDPEFGLRLGYYPLAFLGVELEGAYARARSTAGGANLWIPRLHVIAQLPRKLAPVIPFVTAGAGLLILESNSGVLGDDTDFAAHWGLGAKLSLSECAAFRLEARHIIAPDDIAVRSHFEVLGGVSFQFGQPGEDADGDGFVGAADHCPAKFGAAPHGCPDLDPDKDGVQGDADQCPLTPETANGYQDEDGCPDTLPEELKKFTGTIKGINFGSGSAKIKASSHATLDQTVGVLKRYPAVRLKISGHTDSLGSDKLNQSVSQQRAEAVRQYLIDKGVAEARLEAMGYGRHRPLATNDTAEGRAKNRRIEFELAR